MLIKYFKDIYTTKSEYPYTIYIHWQMFSQNKKKQRHNACHILEKDYLCNNITKKTLQ